MAPEKLDEALRAKSLNLPAAVREWYLLAANWDHGGLSVWIRPQALTACDGMVCVCTDTQGINNWGIRVAHLGIEDPPTFSLEGDSNEIDFPNFTSFVAAMTVNDVLFDYEAEAPVQLDPGSARADLTRLVSARCGDFYLDGSLASATVVAFAYPGNGPVFGKSREPEGHALLQRLRLPTT
jgi:hypothetical protein